MDSIRKNDLFEKEHPARALAVMALPTVASQMILLIYNLADTWFIGRTNNPYMIGAASLGLTVYLAAVSVANVFGVGGGSLMIRLVGSKKAEEARKVASYSLFSATVWALVFALLILVFLNPILKLLGASENSIGYGRQYLITTSVIGAVPTVLSMCMPHLLRNAGYSKEAGIGVGLGSVMNVILDPLFMFVLLPEGYEVLGAGIATMLSNVISLVYFIWIFRKVRGETVLDLPKRMERIGTENKKALYSVGLPAAISIFLFDVVTIVINRLASSYGDIPLAAVGIVLKLERIPINTGLGVCLGMVPLIAYNYGSGNRKRMQEISSLARAVIIGMSCLCAVLFRLFAAPLVGAFIAEDETVRIGARFLSGRCFSLPFMMLGYHIVNYMNAVGKGKTSFLLAILRHLVLIIPIMLALNAAFGMNGLIWSQLAADVLNALIAGAVFVSVSRKLCRDAQDIS